MSEKIKKWERVSMENMKNVNVSFVRFSDDYVLECKNDREKLEKLKENSLFS